MTFWRARSPESHLSPLTYENKIRTTYIRLTNILTVSCDAARSQCVYHLCASGVPSCMQMEKTLCEETWVLPEPVFSQLS